MYTEEELFNTFSTYIWPNMEKMKSECLSSTNNLMKMMMVWSERPRFYPLLVVKSANFSQATQPQSEKTILDYLFELIDSRECSDSVINFVMNFVYNLVSFADFKDNSMEIDDVETVAALPVKLNIDLSYDTTLASKLKF